MQRNMTGDGKAQALRSWASFVRFRPNAAFATRCGGAGCLLALQIAVASPALAQQTSEFLASDIPTNPARGGPVAVGDRVHPEWTPVGLRAGGFLLLPVVKSAFGYTDNVYGSTSGTKGDGYEALSASASAVSQWSRHSLELDAGVGLKRFMSQSTRNETAYSVQSVGRYDLGSHGDSIVATGSFSRGFEAQYSGAFPNNAAGTVGYYKAESLLRGSFSLNRLRAVVSGKFANLDYQNTVSLTGAVIDQQYRDRIEYGPAVRLEYRLPADASIFGEFSYGIADYKVVPLTQPARSNNSKRLIAGANFKFSPLVRVLVGAGYEQRDYDSPAYPKLRGAVADARIEWLPTEMTTFNLQASRRMQDAIFPGAPGYFSNVVRIRVDHELLRNVILFGEGSVERDVYVATTRRDRVTQLTAGADYALNRKFRLQPSMRYTRRKSGGALAGQSFNELRLEVSLVFNL